ncbi:hydroxyacylglutathione hydrolase [Alcanivorax sp. 97CO-5]|jgi:hydroxyacylglutathione hydrolase|uniref:hydroxyacylglutathione hydrolase n=1 Tax=Alcanivorax TaxID=59753 RepID=UPI0003E7E2BE|nr:MULTISPECIES: hydroxyacylglutathione hydrolase [unclassified Alcanivorax]EUC71339.1 hydroxyacylglutathione hydrolase [Alcanivorax sp. 97CO-5]PKG02770.1 hydroxyacylglutathione hydrolase [Alcanivorax sp. 97CO-6]
MTASPIAIPAFNDNYIWAFHQQDQCVVVDPGDAEPVERYLRENGLSLSALLITHHHPDHVGGVAALTKHRDIPVYGPAKESIPAMSHPLHEGDTITPAGTDLAFTIMEVPGHTLGHIAFINASHGWLFSGDTLFAGGCGRLFEGTAAQMFHSLERLAALPEATLVFCAHEYTQANLTFAAAVTPNDSAVQTRLQAVTELRKKGKITLPSTLAEEKATNPFLRSDNEEVKASCQRHEPGCGESDIQCFAALRRWKDNA